MNCIKNRNLKIVPTESIHPYSRVLQGLKARGRKSVEMLHLLSLDWPASQRIVQSLVEHLTDLICEDSEPVIYVILERALVRYGEAVHFKTQRKLDDPQRLGIFIDALLSETSRMMDIEICDSSGTCWRVDDTKVSFGEWYLNQGCPIDVGFHLSKDVKENAFREVLFQLITSEQIRNVLRKINYEKTSVVGPVDFSHRTSGNRRVGARRLDQPGDS